MMQAEVSLHRLSNSVYLAFVCLHILVIAASNYLVQIPFNLLGYTTNIGTFSFPIIFLLSDLAVRTFGADQARKIVLVAFLPSAICSYLISVLFFNGSFTSLTELSQFNTFIARIVFASFSAYLISQMLDISLFNRLRSHKIWLLAPLASTTLGSLVDTLSFYAIAFYQSSDEFMAEHWLQMAWFDYTFKMLVSLLVFIPIYKILTDTLSNYLSNKYSS